MIHLAFFLCYFIFWPGKGVLDDVGVLSLSFWRKASAIRWYCMVQYICVCFSVEKFITSSKVEYSYPYVTHVTYVTFDFSEQMIALIQRQFSGSLLCMPAGQDLPHHVKWNTNLITPPFHFSGLHSRQFHIVSKSKKDTNFLFCHPYSPSYAVHKSESRHDYLQGR